MLRRLVGGVPYRFDLTDNEIDRDYDRIMKKEIVLNVENKCLNMIDADLVKIKVTPELHLFNDTWSIIIKINDIEF